MRTVPIASPLDMRALKWVGVITLLGCVLVATHKGEFWPFSIYPMFSQAGRPWERSLVRRVADVPEAELWQPRELETVVGRPLALKALDIPQNDVTKLVKLTKVWDGERIIVLRAMFNEPLSRGERLLLYRVRGHVDEAGHAHTAAEPFLLMEPDGRTLFAPGSPQSRGI